MPRTTPALRATPPRRLPAPRWEPPYDDEVAPLPPTARSGQAQLALSFPLPTGLPATPDLPRLRLVGEEDDGFGRRPTGRDELPEPRAWAARLVQAVVEVLSGERPPAQLLRWTSEEVYARVRTTAAPPRRAMTTRARAHVRSVHVCEPDDGVAEVAAVIVRNGRAQALALRMEGLDGRWQCTTLDVLLPTAAARGTDEPVPAGAAPSAASASVARAAG
ncbi:Rv3235 family protein [Motilibacter deserti]|uniref:3-hydroxyacyl-CoA dehydrogenase n=1 Tax=Motilibacter deserti TaxID=2714956 RepID=A0ABX0GSF3_9ACTN|nr:Rv3235 family protein [Motilibacter deserti]NHC13026.1 hypothetical protein [Motilibacter deserti]